MKFIVRHRETGKYYTGCPEQPTSSLMDLASVYDDEGTEFEKRLYDICKARPHLVEIIPTENG